MSSNRISHFLFSIGRSVREVDERTRPSSLMKVCLGVNFLSSCSSSLSSRTTKDRRKRRKKKRRRRTRGEEKKDVTVEKIETIGIEKCIYQGDKQKKNGNLSINIPEILIYSIAIIIIIIVVARKIKATKSQFYLKFSLPLSVGLY